MKRKRTDECCSKVVGIKKGPWTPEEDEILANYIKREGEGRWRTLPQNAGLLRCGKSCRLRWMNYLRPSIKRGQITPKEEHLILCLHRLLGNRWALIARNIPGHTDNEIKNYWNTRLSKKLISPGLDPRTHKPLDPNPNFPSNPNFSHMHDTCMNHSMNNSSLNPSYPDNSNLNILGFEQPATIHYPINQNISHESDLKPADHRLSSVLGSQGNYYNNDDEDEEEDVIEYYCKNDETFALFLNSVVSENDLSEDQQGQQDFIVSSSVFAYDNGPHIQQNFDWKLHHLA